MFQKKKKKRCQIKSTPGKTGCWDGFYVEEKGEREKNQGRFQPTRIRSTTPGGWGWGSVDRTPRLRSKLLLRWCNCTVRYIISNLIEKERKAEKDGRFASSFPQNSFTPFQNSRYLALNKTWRNAMTLDFCGESYLLLAPMEKASGIPWQRIALRLTNIVARLVAYMNWFRRCFVQDRMLKVHSVAIVSISKRFCFNFSQWAVWGLKLTIEINDPDRDWFGCWLFHGRFGRTLIVVSGWGELR